MLMLFDVCVPCDSWCQSSLTSPLYVCGSGGHLNQAVSLSVCLCGGMQLLLLLPYVVAQLIGGMIGAALAKVKKKEF